MANPFFDTPWQKRLRKDRLEMAEMRNQSSILEFGAEGNDSKYRIRFSGRSLSEGAKVVDLQELEIGLGPSYPRNIPSIRFTTQIMHPNISSGIPCLGGFTMSPMVKLTEIVEILWDMARMSVFNPHSGYGDRARWEVLRREMGFPLDDRVLRDRVPVPPAPQRADKSDDIDLYIMDGHRARRRRS